LCSKNTGGIKILKGVVLGIILSTFLIFAGCSSLKSTSSEVSGKVQVAVVDRMQKPISGAQVIFVSNNKYVGKAVTDSQGKTGEVNIVAPLDPLDKEIMNTDFRRGVANIIVSKQGYRDYVNFEVWVYENTTTTQILKLDSLIEDERNEPEYTVTEPHRLEVIRYVEHYKNIAR
jgi:hypothetical protein